jgi:hypothetical protein
MIFGYFVGCNEPIYDLTIMKCAKKNHMRWIYVEFIDELDLEYCAMFT